MCVDRLENVTSSWASPDTVEDNNFLETVLFEKGTL